MPKMQVRAEVPPLALTAHGAGAERWLRPAAPRANDRNVTRTSKVQIGATTICIVLSLFERAFRILSGVRGDEGRDQIQQRLRSAGGETGRSSPREMKGVRPGSG